MMKACVLAAIMFVCHSVPSWGQSLNVDSLLASGKFDEAVSTLEAHLKVQPSDDTARLGLGITQFVNALQVLGQ